MSRLNVTLEHTRYPIDVEVGILERVGSLCREHTGAAQACIVTDEHVAALYLERVSESLRDAGFQVITVTLPPGEQTKSTRVCDDMYTTLIEQRFERSSVIVALGGGVVGDLAGFVAATYLRGVQLVQVPTTLLAQTDSSVGGKVGVNHALGKNLIGAFYQPRCVIIDPQVLQSLPAREMAAGMAEVVKYGAIGDTDFLDFLEPRLEDLLALKSPEDVAQIILRSCAAKAEVVSKDEREGGLRKILNFGHTFGHAIETVTGYGVFLHGEAVNLGMSAALRMSQQETGLSASDADRFQNMLDRLPIPAVHTEIDTDAVCEAMRRDKKVTGGGVQFVLLERLGSPLVRGDVAAARWTDAIDHGLRRVRRQEPTAGGTAA